MDVALRDLDGPLLAARWARAVLAEDPALVAACEQEATVRGFTAAGLVAATKKKPDDFKRSAGPSNKSYQALANEAKVARDTGNPGGAKRGKTKPENVGKGKFRKKSGAGGGGQFTSADDPEAIAEGEIVAGHKEQQSLSDERAKVRERRTGEDEQQRQQRYEADRADREADAANRDADAQDRAAADARKATRDARKAMEAVEDQDLDDRVRANDNFQRQAQGEITLMQRQLAEARQVGHSDDENDLLDKIKAANEVLAKARQDRADMDTERNTKKTSRATTRVVDATSEAEARAKTAADKRVRDNAKRVRDETKRSTRESERRAIREARAAEDAALAQKAGELRDRIEEARQRKRDAAAARKAEAAAKKAARRGSLTAAFGRFSEDLHPRGKDGKWIELHGLIDVFGLSGFQHGQRGNKHVQGEVAEIIPDPKSPGNPVIRVKMTDPRWSADKFGPTVDVRRNQVQARAKPKAKLTPTTPKAPSAPTAVPQVKPDVTPAKPGVTVIPPRTPTPGMVPHPEGPGFTPLNPPSEWATMTAPEQLAWITDLMHADFTKWRGQETGFDFTGFDPGIALNTANTYRELANWDPGTARRLDNPILSTAGVGGGLNDNAIAVAHPGTAHPGGIGEKIGPASMVFGAKYMSGMKFWKSQQEASSTKEIPWSMSSQYGDPMLTVTHEFSHQRQFRFLDVAMRDANKPFTDGVRDDGFGMVPDSSNWEETQALRYEIQKLAPTKYGKSKSSEAFAEAWTAKMTGDSSPELDNALEQWDVYMGLAEQLPVDRPLDVRGFDELTAAEKDQFWVDNGKYLDLPGMAEHYPDSAAAYSAWQAGKEAPAPTTPFGFGYSDKPADWDTEFGMNMGAQPGEIPDHSWRVVPADSDGPEIHRLQIKDPSVDIDTFISGPEEWEDPNTWHLDVSGSRADGVPLDVHYTGTATSADEAHAKALEALAPLWAADRYEGELPYSPPGGWNMQPAPGGDVELFQPYSLTVAGRPVTIHVANIVRELADGRKVIRGYRLNKAGNPFGAPMSYAVDPSTGFGNRVYGGAEMQAVPVDTAELDDLYHRLDANRRAARRLRLSYPDGIGDPQSQVTHVRPPHVQAEMDQLDAEYSDLRSQYHPPVDYAGPAPAPITPGAIEGPNGTQWEATSAGDITTLVYDHPSGKRLYVDSGPNGVKWSVHEEGHDEPLKAGMSATEGGAMDDALWYANQMDEGPAEMQPVPDLNATTTDAEGNETTPDGFRLLPVAGGQYIIIAPKGTVDDLGQPIREYTIRGRNKALAFVDRVRAWQPRAAPAVPGGIVRDAGNVYVGDEIMLPGDVAGTVTNLEPLNGDWMRIHTNMGVLDVRMSDPIVVIP